MGKVVSESTARKDAEDRARFGESSRIITLEHMLGSVAELDDEFSAEVADECSQQCVPLSSSSFWIIDPRDVFELTASPSSSAASSSASLFTSDRRPPHGPKTQLSFLLSSVDRLAPGRRSERSTIASSLDGASSLSIILKPASRAAIGIFDETERTLSHAACYWLGLSSICHLLEGQPLDPAHLAQPADTALEGKDLLLTGEDG